MSDFVHLHVHSEYSLLDGMARLNDLLSKTKEMGQPALAITDHGVMYATLEFYNRAAAAQIKPIVGCEIYVAPRLMGQKEPKLDTPPSSLDPAGEEQHRLPQPHQDRYSCPVRGVLLQAPRGQTISGREQ